MNSGLRITMPHANGRVACLACRSIRPSMCTPSLARFLSSKLASMAPWIMFCIASISGSTHPSILPMGSTTCTVEGKRGLSHACQELLNRKGTQHTTGAWPASSFIPNLLTEDAPAPLSSSRISVTSFGMSYTIQ
jgi:hypothetical protein